MNKPSLKSFTVKNLTKSLSRIVSLVVVVAVVAFGAYYFLQQAGTKTVTARFASAVGIYSGTPVKILGVNVGEVTGVHPTPNYVAVTITYDDSYKLPANGGAVEVANSLVSDRYVQLAPVYRSGPVMKSGAVIPTARTGAPAELDDIYAALNKLSVALGPRGANKGGRTNGALSTLINVAAANLKGNGTALGVSITKLSQAAQTLSDNKGDLFATVKHLQKFTATLKDSDAQIRLFNTQLAEVAGTLADERGDLGTALHDLGLALDAVNTFVKGNAAKFHTDFQGLRRITGVLVNERTAVDETLAVAPVALANIVHAYQPDIGALGTRSNLASLGNLSAGAALAAVCSSAATTAKNLLGSIGGNAKDVCKAVDKAAGGGSTSPIPVPGGGLGGLLPGGGSSGTGGSGGTGGIAGLGGTGSTAILDGSPILIGSK